MRLNHTTHQHHKKIPVCFERQPIRQLVSRDHALLTLTATQQDIRDFSRVICTHSRGSIIRWLLTDATPSIGPAPYPHSRPLPPAHFSFRPCVEKLIVSTFAWWKLRRRYGPICAPWLWAHCRNWVERCLFCGWSIIVSTKFFFACVKGVERLYILGSLAVQQTVNELSYN